MTGNDSLMSAIRGPVLLTALGILMYLDQLDKISFGRTWPILLILFGIFKLGERVGAHHQ